MKTPTSRLSALFKQAETEQPVRVIKASQAGKFSHSNHNANGNATQGDSAQAAHKPEIRLVQAGPDFCDLEVTCACGESTRVRCWNAPGETAAAA